MMIGVYSNALYSTSFPVSLPQITVFVKVLAPASDPVTSCSVVVKIGERVISEWTASSESLSKPSNESEYEIVGSIINISPFKIDGECELEVEVETDKGKEIGWPLLIRQKPDHFG